MVKLGQMDYATFEKLRDEIVGGDISNVHLVKGLDRRLLERARRGEDVYSKPEVVEPAKSEGKGEKQGEEDVDAALDELEDRDVAPMERKAKAKEDAQASAVAGKKRTRDDILRELKAARQKPPEPVEPALGSKFRKLGARLEPGTSRVEIDDKGREVLITVDEDGHVKRKVRKIKAAVQSAAAEEQKNGLLMPDKDATPLGADAPIIPQKPTAAEERSEDEDVFEGVGAEYDPLSSGGDSDSGSSGTESGEESERRNEPKPSRKQSISQPPTNDSTTKMPPPPPPSKPRNYFNDKPSDTVDNEAPSNPLKDPSFRAFLEKASSIAQKSTDLSGDVEDGEDAKAKAQRLARRKAMLEGNDRDAEDMDLGFGSSRFEDQEEGEDRGFKLSQWDGDADGGEEGGKAKGGQSQRKRGKKKKKGDKNSASDVLAVLDRRGKA